MLRVTRPTSSARGAPLTSTSSATQRSKRCSRWQLHRRQQQQQCRTEAASFTSRMAVNSKGTTGCGVRGQDQPDDMRSVTCDLCIHHNPSQSISTVMSHHRVSHHGVSYQPACAQGNIKVDTPPLPSRSPSPRQTYRHHPERHTARLQRCADDAQLCGVAVAFHGCIPGSQGESSSSRAHALSPGVRVLLSSLRPPTTEASNRTGWRCCSPTGSCSNSSSKVL